jgi:exodeoxyribonuclease VII large subunit
MDHRALFERLRSWRNERAAREGVEPFRIFQNATLELTAQVQPRSVEDLEAIKGWGKKKIEHYGREVVALIDGGEAREEVGDFNFGGQAAGEPVILTVGACIGIMNNALDRVGGITVRGEISDASARGGYAFFDLKDTSGQDSVVKCFIGRWQFEKFKHLVEDGLEVIIVARPSIYKSGFLSLMVETVEPYGAGALRKAFEALKNKLAAQGLFDEERKRAVPSYVQTIGLVTSADGAAVNDFKHNLGEHGFKVFLYDVRVEGVHAERSLVEAVRWFNAEGPQVDVIVLIRGGGFPSGRRQRTDAAPSRHSLPAGACLRCRPA